MYNFGEITRSLLYFNYSFMLALTLGVRLESRGFRLKKKVEREEVEARAVFIFVAPRLPRVRAVEQNSEIRRWPAFIVATPRVHLYS